MKYSSTFSWLIVSGLTFCLPAVVQAQNVKVIADREAARRQAHIPRGEEVLARAQAELHAKQYAGNRTANDAGEWSGSHK